MNQEPQAIALSPPGLFSKKLFANNITTKISFFVLFTDGSIVNYNEMGQETMRTTAANLTYKKKGLLLANTFDVIINGEKFYFTADPSAAHPVGTIGGMPQVAGLVATVSSLNTFFEAIDHFKAGSNMPILTAPVASVQPGVPTTAVPGMPPAVVPGVPAPAQPITQSQIGTVINKSAKKSATALFIFGGILLFLGVLTLLFVSITGAIAPLAIGAAILVRAFVTASRS
ncbi:MAG: hypothetical protein WAO28_01260 [Candidatus Microsaccharimonas sp.]